MVKFLLRPRLPRRFTSLLLPLTFFALLFILPLNRRADGEQLIEDLETALHLPHVHSDYSHHDLDDDVPAAPQPPPPEQPKGGGRKMGIVTGTARFNRRPDGIMVVEDEVLAKSPQHPIEALIKEAKDIAERDVARIPRTLDAAVQLYRDLNGDATPPAGFDKWFDWCQEHDTVAWPHEAAHTSVLPYLALPASSLRERITRLDERVMTSTFDIKGGAVVKNRGTAGTDHYRSISFNALFSSIAHVLPDMTVYTNVDDSPTKSASYDLWHGSIVRANKGELWSDKDIAEVESHGAWGWGMHCAPDSPMQLGALPPDEDDSAPKRFIWSPELSSDICLHPEHQPLHGSYIFGSPGSQPLVPLFSTSITSAHLDLLLPSLDQINVTTVPIPFLDKTDHRVFWRGMTTGLMHGKQWKWKTSQRIRLNLLTNDFEGHANVLVPGRGGRGVERQIMDSGIANERWMDVGFSAQPVQCEKADGTCAEMEEILEFRDRVEPDDAAEYRYMLDVDGNGWSARYRRLLLSGSVILKSTIYKEWHSASLIPWYHYVPVQIDYSDLYDIAAFFESSETSPGRADLAAQIADNGLKYAQERWEWKDAQAYTILALLEYSRAMSDDRDAASFHP